MNSLVGNRTLPLRAGNPPRLHTLFWEPTSPATPNLSMDSFQPTIIGDPASREGEAFALSEEDDPIIFRADMSVPSAQSLHDAVVLSTDPTLSPVFETSLERAAKSLMRMSHEVPGVSKVSAGSWVYVVPGNHDPDLFVLKQREQDLRELLTLSEEWVVPEVDNGGHRNAVYVETLSDLLCVSIPEELKTYRERVKALRSAFQMWAMKIIRALRLTIRWRSRRVLRAQFELPYVVMQRVWHICHGAHPPRGTASAPSLFERPGDRLA